MANNVDLVMRLLAEDKASEAFKKVGTAAEKTGGSYKKFAGVAAGALAGIGIAAFAKDAIGAASDLNETMSKSSVVFGKNADAIANWSNSSAESLGMSKQQAVEAAASFGNLFVALKLGQGPAANMSQNLVQLAADLASFNNVDPAEALDALRSGLVGETEPLRRFGVNLNEATISQKALEMGLVSTTKGTLPPAIKAQAAYALILDQTKTAQGDYARTSDGLANSQRTLTAEIENAKAGLGEALLPAMQAVTHTANAALGVFNKLPGPVKTTTVAVGLLGAGFVILAPRIVAAKNALIEMGVASKVTGANLKGIGKAVGVATAALAAASAAQHAFSESNITLNDALDKLGANHWWDQLGTSIAHLAGAETTMDDAAAAIDNVDESLAGLVSDGKLDQAYTKFTQLRKAYQDGGGDVANFDAQFVKYRASLDAAEQPTVSVTTATKKLGTTAADTAKQIDALKNRIDLWTSRNIDAKQRALQWKDALHSLRDTIKENGRSLDENTVKGRANVEALLDMIQTTTDNAKANLDAGLSYDVVKKKHDTEIQQLRIQAEKLHLNKTAVDKLVAAYGTIPPKKVTQVVASGVAKALADIQSIVAAIRKIPGHAGISVTVDSRGDMNAHGTGGTTGRTTKSVVPSTTRSTSSVADAAHVNVYLDGKHVQTSLVSLKRRQGGVLAI